MKTGVLSYVVFGVVVATAAVSVSTVTVPFLQRTAERKRQKATMHDMQMLGKEIQTGKTPSIRLIVQGLLETSAVSEPSKLHGRGAKT